MPQFNPSSSSGILSNVFSFVSREVESFVTTATGGESIQKRPRSSSTREANPNDTSKRDKRNKVDVPGRGSEVEQGADDSSTGHIVADGQQISNPTASGKVTTKMKQQDARRPKSRDMPPPPTIPAHALNKRPTMPGSLFPRSPSLEPEYAASLAIQPDGVSNDDLLREIRNDAGPSHTPKSSEPASPAKSGSLPSLKRTNTGNSVKSVIDRFSHEADPSLMLPNPAISPHRSVSSPPTLVKSSTAKGKERDLSGWDYDFSFSGDTSGEIRVRGIEQALQEAREEHYRKELEQDPDSSAHLEEREHDKERIRDLEEEVARLKRELAEQRMAKLRMDPPPPPVPPPPPPLHITTVRNRTGSNAVTERFLASARACLRPTSLPVETPINPLYAGQTKHTGVPTVNMAAEDIPAFLSEIKSVKLRRVRTGPKQPPRRVEADPNDLSINMSANIRRDILRDLAESHRAERSMSLESDSLTGEKRKRNDNQSRDVAPKRRATEPSHSDSSSSSVASTSAPSNHTWPTASAADTDITTPSLCSDNENEHESEYTKDDNLPPTPTGGHKPREMQERSQFRGGEMERELTPSPLQKPPRAEVSEIQAPRPIPAVSSHSVFSNRKPASPLLAGAATSRRPLPPARQKERTVSSHQAEAVEIVDDSDSEEDPLDMLSSPLKSKTPSAKPLVHKSSNPQLAASRIPRRTEKEASGVKSKQPSRAPSRTASSASLRTAASQPVAGPSTSTSVSTSNNHVQRRRTLDEEIQRAGDRLWQDADDEAEDSGMESGILTAMGMQRRKGFLARGGSAGQPVYMGAGYVEGAEGDDDEP